jgi:CDP-glucose 4,6-dehydratase
MAAAEPDIVFHLAAQALVLESYRVPIETFAVNVMGTVNVLEAARVTRGKGRRRRQGIIIVTSDKCYAQNGSMQAYREADPMGDNDPYSSSKGCAELVTAAYRRSFADAQIGIATARAGNVVGGGDWAKDRLIPDVIRAFLAKEPLIVRHPKATRPFQHVLDPLTGYLLLAQSLYENPSEFGEGWNFGPSAAGAATVEAVIGILASFWGTSGSWVADRQACLPEAEILALDSSKARARLHWRPQLDLRQALRLSAEWYLEEAANLRRSMCEFTLAQIRAYAGN